MRPGCGSRRLGVAVLAVLLGGCAVLRSHDPQAAAAFEARRAQLESLPRFAVQARVSSGFLGVKGSLFWRQAQDRFQMRFAGPMGASAVSIAGDAREVSIRTAQESFVTTEPAQFMRERLGWVFPVRQLRWWALGLPAPGSGADWHLDPAGRLLWLEQDGWTLEFGDYQAAGALELPRRFELANDETSIKVVVDQWSFE